MNSRIVFVCALLAAGVGEGADLCWKSAADGLFGTGGAWGIGSWQGGYPDEFGVTDAVPGAEDTVWFVPGTYCVRLDGDRSVKKIFANNVDVNTEMQVTLDLNGRKLSVLDSMQHAADNGHATQRFTYRNGKVECEGNLTLGIGYALSYREEVYLDGVEMKLGGTYGVDYSGSEPRLEIRNGTKLECNQLKLWHGWSGAVAKIAGEGTRVETGEVDFKGPGLFAVEDGATLCSTGSLRIVSYEGDCTDKWGGRAVVDNATVTNTGIKTSICIGGRGWDAGSMLGKELILTNNAVCTGYGYCYLGGYNSGLKFLSQSNRLEIVDGALLDMNGFESEGSRTCTGLTSGAHYLSSDNTVVVRNGEYRGRFLNLGTAGDENATGYSTNNWLRIGGTNPVVRLIASYYGNNGSLFLRSGAGISFDLGREGYMGAPIRIEASGGKVVIEKNKKAEYAGVPVRLEVLGREFNAANPKKRVVLIRAGGDSTEAFEELIAGSVQPGASRAGALTVEDGGRELVYTAPPRVGLIIKVR